MVARLLFIENVKIIWVDESVEFGLLSLHFVEGSLSTFLLFLDYMEIKLLLQLPQGYHPA